MKEQVERIGVQIWHSKFTWMLLYVVAVLPIALSLWKGGVGDCDSAYYLLYVGKIAEGFVPYEDIALGYTPLWFYLMYALSAPLGISCYQPEYFLFIHYLFVIGNAICIYFITRFFSKDSKISHLAAWLFLISSHWLQGNIILLEIPSIFFGLLACVLILYHVHKSNQFFILYGIIAACSFWVKQFGLGFVLLCALLIVFEEKRWQKLILYFLGYALTFVFCFCILGENLLPVIFSSYGTKTAVEAGYDKSISAVISGWADAMVWLLWRVVPVVLIGVLMIKIPFKDKTKVREWLFCICGFLGFSLQFVFTRGLHYCLYLIPFAFIFSALLCSYLRLYKKRQCMYVCMYVCMAAMIGENLYSTYHNRVWKHYINLNVVQSQKERARKIKEYIAEDETIWIIHGGLFYAYYYGQLTPPNLKERGYAFGPLAVNKGQAWQNIHMADWCLKFNTTYPYDYFFTDSMKQFVEQHPAIIIDEATTLYDMRE